MRFYGVGVVSCFGIVRCAVASSIIIFLSIGGVSFRVPVRLFYHFGLFDDYFNFDCYECGGVLVGFQ